MGGREGKKTLGGFARKSRRKNKRNEENKEKIVNRRRDECPSHRMETQTSKKVASRHRRVCDLERGLGRGHSSLVPVLCRTVADKTIWAAIGGI